MAGYNMQGIVRIENGDYTEMYYNVVILTINRYFLASIRHAVRDVKIGAYYWLGFNSVVRSGITLGDHSVVVAGAILTKVGWCSQTNFPRSLKPFLSPPQSCVAIYMMFS